MSGSSGRPKKVLHPLGPEADAEYSLAIKERSPKACIACRTRKVKCDKQSPCGNCAKTKLECIFPSPIRTCYRPKKSQAQKEAVAAATNPELKERVDKLESVSGGFDTRIAQVDCELMARPPDRRRFDQGSGNRETPVRGRFPDWKKFNRIFAP